MPEAPPGRGEARRPMVVRLGSPNSLCAAVAGVATQQRHPQARLSLPAFGGVAPRRSATWTSSWTSNPLPPRAAAPTSTAVAFSFAAAWTQFRCHEPDVADCSSRSWRSNSDCASATRPPPPKSSGTAPPAILIRSPTPSRRRRATTPAAIASSCTRITMSRRSARPPSRRTWPRRGACRGGWRRRWTEPAGG